MHHKNTESTRKRKIFGTNDKKIEDKKEIQPEKRQRKISHCEEFLPLPQNEGFCIVLFFSFSLIFPFYYTRKEIIKAHTKSPGKSRMF